MNVRAAPTRSIDWRAPKPPLSSGRCWSAHGELRSEAEAIARAMLAEISPFSVADDVENAVLQFDSDDLNSRAGNHSWGYVEPSEAAQELLDEAVEPFAGDMKRYLENEA